MRLDLFSKEDSILLLGEGNFSFSVDLLKSNITNNIISTCFEKEIAYDQQVENINYLKSKNVKVLLDVDATKLHENENFFGKYYSKIIFNFPHTGGKMKIHLNRELLKNFFISVNHLVTEKGKVIVSLCNGQGGVPLDKPPRRWDDSWQIIEMAAYGDFILTDVESFCKKNFPTYHCVGYRSQDVQFNLDGALVYIFEKRKNLYNILMAKGVTKTWSSLRNFSCILVPTVYAELYDINPLLNPKSSVSFFKNLIIKHLKRVFSNVRLKFYSDKNIPLFFQKNFGIKCKIQSNDFDFRLRSSVFDVLNFIFKSKHFDVQNDVIFFPGMYFLPYLGLDLFRKEPVKIKFLILGRNLEKIFVTFFEKLSKIFQEKSYNFQIEEKKLNKEKNMIENVKIESKIKIICKNEITEKIITLSNIYFLEKDIQCLVINVAKLCNNFFKTSSWKQIWSKEHKVLTEFKKIPVLKQPLLFPRAYTLDLNLRYEKDEILKEEKVYEVLWHAFGQIIESIEMINQYNSNKNWSSKCFRITYKSLDKPLHKESVINIQLKIICPLLKRNLKISIG